MLLSDEIPAVHSVKIVGGGAEDVVNTEVVTTHWDQMTQEEKDSLVREVGADAEVLFTTPTNNIELVESFAFAQAEDAVALSYIGVHTLGGQVLNPEKSAEGGYLAIQGLAVNSRHSDHVASVQVVSSIWDAGPRSPSAVPPCVPLWAYTVPPGYMPTGYVWLADVLQEGEIQSVQRADVDDNKSWRFSLARDGIPLEIWLDGESMAFARKIRRGRRKGGPLYEIEITEMKLLEEKGVQVPTKCRYVWYASDGRPNIVATAQVDSYTTDRAACEEVFRACLPRTDCLVRDQRFGCSYRVGAPASNRDLLDVSDQLVRKYAATVDERLDLSDPRLRLLVGGELPALFPSSANNPANL